MERKIQIVTDTGSDFPNGIAEEYNINVVPFSVVMQGGARVVPSNQMAAHEFYQVLRTKEPISTSAAAIPDYTDCFEPYLKEGKDVLYLCFSSGLSSSIRAAMNAADDLMLRYTDRRIVIVDTLGASGGAALICYLTAKYADETGADVKACAAYANRIKLRVRHEFTVDDLFFLRRGGRISTATAVLGSMLAIKPILHVDNEGHLINLSKERGRQGAIACLAKKVKEYITEKDTVFINHGDCPEDAETLANLIREQVGPKELRIGYIGSTVGAHSGAGTLAVFFLGNER